MNKIPNLLTILRILSIPLLIFLVLSSSNFYNFFALILFILISITDYLDGFLARKMNVVSKFGEMLDPIADKIFIISVRTLIIKILSAIGSNISPNLDTTFIFLARNPSK